jgi:uncharacterized protein YcbK (DUF882 family)
MRSRRRAHASRSLLLLVSISLFIARDAPARALTLGRIAREASLTAGLREARVASWATSLERLTVTSASTRSMARIGLYDQAGEIDETARAYFERIASRNGDSHALSPRVEQLVFKAAYHFGVERVQVVSGWREHAGKHSTGEAVDFRLPGIRPAVVAAYLRGLPRVGVGLYTHPGTQFVHVDVRDPSYYWIDASPPGVHWLERSMGVGKAERDGAYVPEMDLP